MPNADDMARSAITQRAAEWFVAHRSGALGVGERAAFVAWLKASPEHVREYLAMAGISRDTALAARALDIDIEELVRSAQTEDKHNVVSLREGAGRAASTPSARRRWPYVMAASLAALAVAAGALWTLRDGERFGLPRAYETAHAEQSTWRLPDGSVMHLNTDTKVHVHFSGGERCIDIDRGQAHFSVVHEAKRRFRVSAGQADVIALGTEFDVYRRMRDTVVTVVEGKVAVVTGSESKLQSGAQRVAHGDGAAEQAGSGVAPTPTRGRDAPRSIELVGGQRINVGTETSPVAPMQANLRENTAWLQRQIVFEQRPLAEVTEEFNRYSRLPIEIDDDRLRTLRISGVFSAYDTDSFVGFLQRLDGVAVENAADRIRVHGRDNSSEGLAIAAH